MCCVRSSRISIFAVGTIHYRLIASPLTRVPSHGPFLQCGRTVYGPRLALCVPYRRSASYVPPMLIELKQTDLSPDLTLASAIEAGVSTIFVGLGEDPYVLAARAPALFDVSLLLP